MKFYLWMDNSSDTVLTKQSCCSSQYHLPFQALSRQFLMITSYDAESCEEQDGGKQILVGQMTAELQAVFKRYVTKNMEKKRKPKILALMKKVAFPASFAN